MKSPRHVGSPAWSRALRASAFAAVAVAVAGGLWLGRRPETPVQVPGEASVSSTPAPLPQLLSETGLYVPGSTTEVAPENLLYVPQYPLWSDGAAKRRWIRLPPGARIDAAQPDAWQFPLGTRFWKEFSFGSRTETRFIERLADGTFRFATYVWDAALGDAVLAPEAGTQVTGDGGVQHTIPSRADCRACHEGRPTTILGFNALQLSPDRDPLAPNREPVPEAAVDLTALLQRGVIANLPGSLTTPRIRAASPTARAALGYLYGNCSNCHNAQGPLAELELDFDQSILASASADRALETTLARASRFRVAGEAASQRIAPGDPAHSAVWFRMRSREPAAQMPPLGTARVDEAATQLIAEWISTDLKPTHATKETSP